MIVSNDYIRKPLVVQATLITKENIAEVAQFVGELGEKEDGTPYIEVDRKKCPGLYRVYPGFVMTRMGDHTRCFLKRVFDAQFVVATPQVLEWVDHLDNVPR